MRLCSNSSRTEPKSAKGETLKPKSCRQSGLVNLLGYPPFQSDVDDESIEQKLNELATSKEVEQEAIREVTEWYELHGWHVESKEADHIGYDLHCTKGSECRHVEVKGRSQLPDVVLFTVNEWNNAVNDGQFYVAIVSGIGNKRRSMIQWTAQEFQREYEVKPIVYHAKRLNEGKDTYTR